MDKNDNSTYRRRVEIPINLWKLFEETSKITRIKTGLLFDLWLYRVTIRAASGQLDEAMGPEFMQAYQQMQMRGGIKPIDAGIDTSLLHRSSRLKSGYVGVYANGKGFRADGTHPSGKGVQYIGTFQTPEAAAWARYIHHKQHNLPYGDTAEAIEQLFKEIARAKQMYPTLTLDEDSHSELLLDDSYSDMNMAGIVNRIYELKVKYGKIDGTKIREIDEKRIEIAEKAAKAVGAVFDRTLLAGDEEDPGADDTEHAEAE